MNNIQNFLQIKELARIRGNEKEWSIALKQIKEGNIRLYSEELFLTPSHDNSLRT